MNRLRWIALTAALLCLLAVALTAAAPALAQTGVQVTTTAVTRLRSGPGTDFAQIGSIPFNTTLPAIGRNADTTWIQVSYNGMVGWVAAFLVTVAGDVNTLPVGGVAGPPPDQGTPPPPPPPPGAVTGTNASQINVRSGPAVSNAVLGTLPAGSTIVPDGRWGTGSSAWLRFNYNGQQGWVAAWLLKITGDLNTLPDLQAQQAAAEAAVRQMCATGVAVPLAASYAGGPGIHPTLMLDTATGGPHVWASQQPAWRPGTALATQLVACIDPERENMIQECLYYGPSIFRYQYSMHVRLLVAQTGQTLSDTTLWAAPPRECQQWEDYWLTRLAGPHVSSTDLFNWLRPFVQP